MRVVFEIVHPADVLFFKRPLETLRARGTETLVLSRQKDIACDLLDEFGIPHRPVSRAGIGLAGLASEFARRSIAVYREARRFQPDVMIGFGGVAIAYAGKALSVPTVSFYDSENATLQTRITWPLITHLYVPVSYAGPTPDGRTTRLRGVKELSYLHPSVFRPDRDTALAVGLVPSARNYFVRVVAWRANHDVGKVGWSVDVLRKVVSRLSDAGKVHLSSEQPLPKDLEKYAYLGPKNAVHHLLAHCDAMIGESATMASEAAVLGLPAIYAGRDFPGYVRELGDAGLVLNVEDFDEARLLEATEKVLATSRDAVRKARDGYVAACPNWASSVVEAINRHGL